jgi:aspartyl-tRNA(Asn)/glutamyl-tRNA(Gln) amidotransferase subunit A
LTVADACLVYHALRGDAHPALPAPMPLHGLRIAVPRRYFCDLLDDDVRSHFEGALDRLRAAGAHIDEISIRHAADVAAIYLHIVLSEAAAYHAATLESVPDKYTPNVRLRLEMGRYILAEDYARAMAGREALRREVDAAVAQHDALALPTLAIPAPPLGASTVRVGASTEPVRNIMLRLTQPFNVTGHPAISIPSGRTADALPSGLQLVGCRGQTDALLKVALACEPYIAGGPAPRSGARGG